MTIGFQFHIYIYTQKTTARGYIYMSKWFYLGRGVTVYIFFFVDFYENSCNQHYCFHSLSKIKAILKRKNRAKELGALLHLCCRLDTVLDTGEYPCPQGAYRGQDRSAGTVAEVLQQDRRRIEACLDKGQAWGIKEGFLEETMPELDLEGEEPVSPRKRSLGSGENLPEAIICTKGQRP